MDKLLSLLIRQYPLSLTQAELLQILSSGQTKALLNIKVLYQGANLKSAECSVCHGRHTVQIISPKCAYIVCDDGEIGPEWIDPKSLCTWQVDLPRLLEVVAGYLSRTPAVKEVTKQSIWYVGNYREDHSELPVFYARNFISLPDLNQLSQYRGYTHFIILGPGILSTKVSNDLIYLPLANFINFDKSTLSLDLHAFKQRVHSILISQAQQDSMNSKRTTESNVEPVVYWLSQKESGDVLINDQYLLCRPNVDTAGDNVISYLLKKDNGTEFTKPQIETDSGTTIERKLTQIIYDMGFKGNVKKLFLPRISEKGKMRFYKTATRSECLARDVDVDSLNVELQKLNQVQSNPK